MLDDALVRDLCEEISKEKDDQRVAELLACLRTFIELENAEARLRIRQILLHYRDIIPSIAALADPSPSPNAN
jgi:hypothetical protein